MPPSKTAQKVTASDKSWLTNCHGASLSQAGWLAGNKEADARRGGQGLLSGAPRRHTCPHKGMCSAGAPQGAYQPLFLPVTQTAPRNLSPLPPPSSPINPFGCACLWAQGPSIYSHDTQIPFGLKSWAHKTLVCVGHLVTSACLSVSCDTEKY